MLSSRKRRIAIGASLLVLAVLVLSLASGRVVLRHTHRHVVVEVFNIDGIAQVFANCHLAATVENDESGVRVDLGWLKPGDRVFLSATSRDASPAWGFEAGSNGKSFFETTGGDAEAPGFAAEANAVVFAKAFSAEGEYLGLLGCQPPGVVAIQGYAWAHDDATVPKARGPHVSYRPPSDPIEQLDSAGPRSLIALALLGAAAALIAAPIRRLAWEHKGRLATGALALLGAGLFGVADLPAILSLLGILLLIALAILMLWPSGWAWLERAAGSSGSKP